jgi:site-specific DNA-methyltransferase (cytosine-N4-specific)
VVEPDSFDALAEEQLFNVSTPDITEMEQVDSNHADSTNGQLPDLQPDERDGTIRLSEELAEMRDAARKLGYADAREYLLALHELNRTGQIHVPSKKLDIAPGASPPREVVRRPLGTLYQGDSSTLMLRTLEQDSVDLIMTSPPFGLIKKKAYGNEDADNYVDWFEKFARGFHRVLKDSGSLVIDIGGAWKKGLPVRSLYHYELLIRLCRGYGFHLAQEFYWWNPAKLPLPAEWVNVRRIRVKDSVNCVWWLSKSPYPRASNKRVLQPYSDSMHELFERGSYNTDTRSGGHTPGKESFLAEHGGSIPHNLIALANTESTGTYQQYCAENDIEVHPARFPAALPAFFIRMLTDVGDTVLDPFAGSCVTGEVAEQMGRRWICCELDSEYVAGARGRFNGERDTSPRTYQPSRTEPYKAYPPCLSILREEDSPLPRDGGHNRVRETNDVAGGETDA